MLRDLTVTQDGTVVVADGERVQFFAKNGQVAKPPMELANAVAVAECRVTKDLYVRESRPSRIQIFRDGCSHRPNFGSTMHDNSRMSGGMAVGAHGHVFITSELRATAFYRAYIHMFYKDDHPVSFGEHRSTVGPVSDGLFSEAPWGIAVNDATSEVFVADTGNHRVQVCLSIYLPRALPFLPTHSWIT
jgi:hypothetical protein